MPRIRRQRDPSKWMRNQCFVGGIYQDRTLLLFQLSWNKLQRGYLMYYGNRFIRYFVTSMQNMVDPCSTEGKDRN